MTSTTEQNKGVVKRFLEAWNDREADVFDQVVAANVVRHCQATPAVEIHSLAQLKQFLQQDSAIFPDSSKQLGIWWRREISSPRGVGTKARSRDRWGHFRPPVPEWTLILARCSTWRAERSRSGG